MSGSLSCITCGVVFKTADLQREHYKSDWHRYNLKRRVVSIPPVTLQDFEHRVQEQRDLANQESKDELHYCKCCTKVFNTKNAYSNHLNSKKHKLAEERYLEVEEEEPISNNSDADSFVKVETSNVNRGNKFVVLNPNNAENDDIETDSEIEEVSKDHCYPILS